MDDDLRALPFLRSVISRSLAIFNAIACLSAGNHRPSLPANDTQLVTGRQDYVSSFLRSLFEEQSKNTSKKSSDD